MVLKTSNIKNIEGNSHNIIITFNRNGPFLSNTNILISKGSLYKKECDELRFPCPCCEYNQILIYFLDDLVLNCDGQSIDFHYPTHCYACEEKLNDINIFKQFGMIS